MEHEKACVMCGKPFNGRGKYCSRRCSDAAVEDSINQLKNKKGPIYEKWKRKLKDSLKRL